jgi:hypothetical protein
MGLGSAKGKKLVVEFPLSGNDLDQGDLELFKDECDADGAVITLFVERAIGETGEEAKLSRSFSIGGEYFLVSIQEVPE